MMTSYKLRKVRSVGAAAALLVALGLMLTVDAVWAEQQPAAEQPPPIPPSTNPTEKVIYPAEGQSEEQQLSDQLECYRWATTQTAWDPHQAEAVLREKPGDVAPDVGSTGS